MEEVGDMGIVLVDFMEAGKVSFHSGSGGCVGDAWGFHQCGLRMVNRYEGTAIPEPMKSWGCWAAESMTGLLGECALQRCGGWT